LIGKDGHIFEVYVSEFKPDFTYVFYAHSIAIPEECSLHQFCEKCARYGIFGIYCAAASELCVFGRAIFGENH
jgi:hypothetical protein